jgi:hypothetical protein
MAGVSFTAAEKLAAVMRELGFRRRVYARRVAEGKMTQQQSDREIGVFEAIAKDYESAAASERLL